MIFQKQTPKLQHCVVRKAIACIAVGSKISNVKRQQTLCISWRSTSWGQPPTRSLVEMTTAIALSRPECAILKAVVTAVNSDVLLYDPTDHRSPQCSSLSVRLSPKYHLTRSSGPRLRGAGQTDLGRPAESASDPCDVDIGRRYYFSGASLQCPTVLRLPPAQKFNDLPPEVPNC